MKQRKTNKKTVLWFTAFLVLILIGIGRPVKAETEGEIKLKGDCYYCYEDYDEEGDGIRIVGIRKGVKNPTIPNRIDGEKVLWIGLDSDLENVEKNINTLKIPRYVEEYHDYLYPITVKNYEVHSKNGKYCTKEGCLYSDNGKLLEAYPKGRQEKSFAIPKGTVEIGENAFMNSQVEKVSMPNSVKYIGDSAFKGTKLKSIKLSSRLTVIEDEAFRETDISEIVFPKSLQCIHTSAFKGCKNLKMVTIPKKNHLNRIMTAAFRGCSQLEEFIYPQPNVLEAEIENNAFRNCKKMKKVIIEGNTEIQYYAFYGCESLQTVNLDKNVRSVCIYKGAFQKCGKLKKIRISSDGKIGKIHEQAFIQEGEKKDLTIVARKNSYVYRYGRKHKKQGFKVKQLK